MAKANDCHLFLGASPLLSLQPLLSVRSDACMQKSVTGQHFIAASELLQQKHCLSPSINCQNLDLRVMKKWSDLRVMKSQKGKTVPVTLSYGHDYLPCKTTFGRPVWNEFLELFWIAFCRYKMLQLCCSIIVTGSSSHQHHLSDYTIHSHAHLASPRRGVMSNSQEDSAVGLLGSRRLLL